jgi:hypothetical protein
MDFTDNDYKFFNDEFGFDRSAIDTMESDEQSDLYDKCLEIELAETPGSNNETMSERGQAAVRLVDLIHGPYDSEEDE